MTWSEWIADVLLPGVTFSPVVGFEVALCVIALVVAVTRPRLGFEFFEHVEARFQRLATQPVASLVFVFVFAILLRLALLPVAPVPVPGVNDEFSYLLASDTFVHGRLANPTHPMWTHFESIHIEQLPTYASMYPPVQGLILAAGQLAGHPWIGVLVTSALMSVALTWMLRGWMTPGWALFGGVLSVLRLDTFTYWINSYYGGAHAAIGGAMILGALPRLRQAPSVRESLILAAGLALLINSRPFEGAVLGVIAGLTLLAWTLRGSLSWHLAIRRIAVPAALALLVVAGAMGYYNKRVFGSALTMPYTVDRTTYAVTPMFVFEPLSPMPTYHHEVLRKFYAEWEPMPYRYLRSFYGFRHALLDRYEIVERFFLGPLLLLPLIAFSGAFFAARLRVLAVTAIVLFAFMTTTTWLLPHYLAAVTCAIYAIVLEAMRRMRRWTIRGKPAGLFLVRAALPIAAASIAFVAGVRAEGVEPSSASSWELVAQTAGLRERAALIDSLSRQAPGKHLVIVQYRPGHDVHKEWVYNDADIDASPVVFAREMNPEEDAKLIGYFGDRHVWILEPDVTPIRLTSYSTGQ